jgi:hypothetical protein
MGLWSIEEMEHWRLKSPTPQHPNAPSSYRPIELILFVSYTRHTLSCSDTSFSLLPLRIYLKNLYYSEQIEKSIQGGSVMQTMKLGNHNISRLICAGNPFGGYAHGGNLAYLGRLFKEYFTDEKIAETLQICTVNGVNTALIETEDNILRSLDLYEKRMGHRIQWICQIPPDRKNLGLMVHIKQQIQIAADNKAVCAFIQGAATEAIFSANRTAELKELIAFIKDKGIVAGVCAHKADIIEKAEELGLGAEFYMLTLNKVGYCCDDPEAAKRAMKKINKPFISFKVLGAGRDKPESGFRNAFEAGAAFIAVGMFDFQVKENADLVNKILGS